MNRRRIKVQVHAGQEGVCQHLRNWRRFDCVIHHFSRAALVSNAIGLDDCDRLDEDSLEELEHALACTLAAIHQGYPHLRRQYQIRPFTWTPKRCAK